MVLKILWNCSLRAKKPGKPKKIEIKIKELIRKLTKSLNLTKNSKEYRELGKSWKPTKNWNIKGDIKKKNINKPKIKKKKPNIVDLLKVLNSV